MIERGPVIISLGIGGIYPKLLDRLRESCLKFKLEHWLFHEYPPGARSHQESPYGFKVHTIEQALQRGFKTIIWADSAVYVIRDPSPFFRLVEEKGIVLFGCGPALDRFVDSKSLKLFGLKQDDLKKRCLICGALFGFDFNHPKAVDFFDELKVREKDNQFKCDNQRASDRFEAHRHDETIMSLMTIKHKTELTDYINYFQGTAESVMFKAGKDI